MIGALRHEIQIQSRTDADDGIGGVTSSWATTITTFASIRPARSSERMFAQRRELNVTHVIRIRYQSGIDATQRIVFGSRTFQIRGLINVEERGIWLDIEAEEGVQS